MKKLSKNKPNYTEEGLAEVKNELNKIKLSAADEEKAFIETGIETSKNLILEIPIFEKIAKPIKHILDFSNNFNEKLSKKKEEALLGLYILKTKKNKNSIELLHKMILDPYGSIIFKKIITLTNPVPPKKDLLNLIANVIHNVASKDEFEKFFDENFFAIHQIERMSPAALIMFSKIHFGEVINVPLDNQLRAPSRDEELERGVANSLRATMKIQNSQPTIQSALHELINLGLLLIDKVDSPMYTQMNVKVNLTEVGSKVLEYIKE